jgi:hypothetical protein
MATAAVGAGAESGGKKGSGRYGAAAAVAGRHRHSRSTPSPHSNFFVVAHTDLSFLRADPVGLRSSGWACSAAKPSGGSVAMATVALALDDAFGHTMFEGRSKAIRHGRATP